VLFISAKPSLKVIHISVTDMKHKPFNFALLTLQLSAALSLAGNRETCFLSVY
jgi:hypothetical protein